MQGHQHHLVLVKNVLCSCGGTCTSNHAAYLRPSKTQEVFSALVSPPGKIFLAVYSQTGSLSACLEETWFGLQLSQFTNQQQFGLFGFSFPNTHSSFLYAPFRLFLLFECVVDLGIVNCT